EVEAAGKAEGQEYFERVLQVIREVVEEHIAEPPARQYSYEAVGEDVLQEFLVVFSEPGLGAGAVPGQEVGHREGDDVHEAVPLDFHRAQAEEDRIHPFGQMLPPIGKSAHVTALCWRTGWKIAIFLPWTVYGAFPERHQDRLPLRTGRHLRLPFRRRQALSRGRLELRQRRRWRRHARMGRRAAARKGRGGFFRHRGNFPAAFR